MGRYRSKPSEIEAIQWTGDNFREVQDFVGAPRVGIGHEKIAPTRLRSRLSLLAGKDGAQGWVTVPAGHWIVRQPGDLTDHWPVDDSYFRNKYEPSGGVA